MDNVKKEERIKEKVEKGRRWERSLRKKGMQELLKDSPFLLISFLFHLAILFLLVFITAQEPRQRPDRIEVRVERLDTEEVDLEPMVREERLTDSLDASTAAGEGGGEGAAGGEGFQQAAARAGDIMADSPNILCARSVMGAGSGGQFEGMGSGGFELVGGDGGEGVGGALDQFAVVTMNSAAQGKTLVVLNIDRTRSVVYLNLPVLIDRMENYFSALDRNLTDAMIENVRWVVVGYGQDVQFYTQPSGDLDHLQAALRNIDVCPTGEQNLGASLERILQRYGDYGHRRMLIGTMTDGYGSDLRDGTRLERLTQRMRDSRSSLFVFGHEAAFASNRKRKSLTLDPDLLNEEDRAAIRGFEGRTIEDWVDAGPESPRRELWSGNRHWGWDDRHLPASGFGMWAMNRMVLATGGIYFLLEEESSWDEEKLYSRYAPDMCSVPEYDNRMRNEPLRHALSIVWDEMNNLYVPPEGRRFRVLTVDEDGRPRDATSRANDQIRETLREIRRRRSYVQERLEVLRNLLDQADERSMNNYGRWRAHAQVTIAELLRMRFMLGQFAEVLDRFWQEHDRNLTLQKLFSEDRLQQIGTEGRPRDRYYLRITSGRAPDDFVGPQAARDEYDEARNYARLLAEEHSGTPWAWLADRIRNNLHPWSPDPGLRRHRPGGSSPRPPRLPL